MILQDTAAIAAKYINSTDQNIFLTGKAGTGKTTFLKYIVDHTHKNTVVAAPTGIAAINAGGVTLHSLLQLPFGTFIPENIPFSDGDQAITTPQSLVRNIKFNSNKRALLNEIELLIIDEVSMLRADLLDCIDHTLRYVRRNQQLFGGVQILFIGDLMQLPPVVKESEQKRLRSYYQSFYFFEANALQNERPVLLELDKIFRQSDQEFIDILNRFRNNEQSEDDIHSLNRHYEPSFDEVFNTGYIHLTTHNHRAFQINSTRLQQIESEAFNYEAEIGGEFPENMAPTEQKLVLKQGAQIMFIKNDPSGEGKFFNGKIGWVSKLDKGEIWAKDESGHELMVESYAWENKRFTLDTKSGEIEEKVLGTFQQFPIKLAWAVTIHKSQGLTFEKAILDLGQTFAPGQLYVALSRLTSLKYLVLSSPLPEKAPEIDSRLASFSQSFLSKEELTQFLPEASKSYLKKVCISSFSLDGLYVPNLLGKVDSSSFKESLSSLKNTSRTFEKQLESVFVQEEYLDFLNERISKAADYFRSQIEELLKNFDALHKAAKKESKDKKALKELSSFATNLDNKQRNMLKAKLLIASFIEDKDLSKEDLRNGGFYQVKQEKKVIKTPTAQQSYEFYLKGLSIPDIAKERGLVSSTIESHLAQYVENGSIDVHDLVSKDRITKITDLINEGNERSGELKEKLPSDYTYGEIKLVQSYIKSMEAANE